MTQFLSTLGKFGVAAQDENAAMQTQKAVSAYFSSNQILPFGFAAL